jgi:PncC family amidohydrolase
MTLSVAESCTGGLLGKIVTDIPGSSDYFMGGIIAYSNDIKIKQLSVPPDILTKHGAVSEACARFMADGARKSFGSDIAVSITGIAGPDGGTPEKPVGLIYIGLSTADKAYVREERFGGDRERNRERSATNALDMIRRFLIGKLT